LNDEFEKIERDMALDRSIVFGVYWWDLWMYPLYQNIIRAGVQKKHKPLLPLRRLFQGITRLSYLFVRKRSILILRHPRFKMEGDRYVDIYTEIVGGHLEDLGYNPVYLEKRTPQSKRLDPVPVYPLDLIAAISSLLAKVASVSLMKRFSLSYVDKVLYRFGVSDPKSLGKIILNLQHFF
jgi:hypothetical protein